MGDNQKKLFGIFSCRISTYFRYAFLVILMYFSFVFIFIYIPYLVKGTIQNLIFWFFLLAIFDQLFIAIENWINPKILKRNLFQEKKMKKSNKISWFFLILSLFFVIGVFIFDYFLNLAFGILAFILFILAIFFTENNPKESKSEEISQERVGGDKNEELN